MFAQFRQKNFITTLSQTKASILTVSLATTIGLAVPDSYAERPVLILIIGLLIGSMLYVWQYVLGSSELDIEKFCVSDSYSIGVRTSVSILRLSDGISPCIVFASHGTNKLIVRRLDQNISSYDCHEAPTTAVILGTNESVFSGDANGVIHEWNIENGTTKQVFKKHNTKILSLSLSRFAVSSMQRVLMSCGCDGSLYLWDLDTGKYHSYSFGQQGLESTVRFLSAAQSICQQLIVRVALGTNSGEVHAWDVANQKRSVLLGHYGPVTALCITDSHPNACVISASADWTVRIWDFTAGVSLRTLQGHSGSVDALAILEGPMPMVVSAGKDATVRVWNVATGELYRTLEGHTQEVFTVSLQQSPTLSSSVSLGTRSIPLIISCGSEQSIRIWNLDRIIRDLKWNRRKEFAIFFSQIKNAIPPNQDDRLVDPQRGLMSILSIIDIRNIIAAYL